MYMWGLRGRKNLTYICHIAIFPSLYKASTAGPAIAEWSAPGNSGKAAGLPVDSKEDLLPPQRCGCLPRISLNVPCLCMKIV